MVGEVFHIGGVLVLDAFGQILQLVLNQAAPLASILVDGVGKLLTSAHGTMRLGQTSDACPGASREPPQLLDGTRTCA